MVTIVAHNTPLLFEGVNSTPVDARRDAPGRPHASAERR